MKDDNCIFCKLANGDIPTNTIYEDADFRVILDASPAAKGHALILPKQHYANMFEIDDEVLAKAAKLAISSKSSAFGRYFDGIGGYTEKDGPCAGWLFTVNGEMPSVSCDRYALSDHDTVEWVFRPDQRNAYGG